MWYQNTHLYRYTDNQWLQLNLYGQITGKLDPNAYSKYGFLNGYKYKENEL